jgi:hypothetical protein
MEMFGWFGSAAGWVLWSDGGVGDKAPAQQLGMLF